jgi:putative transcriptional regulator
MAGHTMHKVHCKLAFLMAAQKPKLSQNRLAAETGLGITTVNRLFNNKFSRIDTHTVMTLCNYFSCDLGDLLVVQIQ